MKVGSSFCRAMQQKSESFQKVKSQLGRVLFRISNTLEKGPIIDKSKLEEAKSGLARLMVTERRPATSELKASEAVSQKHAPKPPMNTQSKAVIRDVKADPVAANAKKTVTIGPKFSGQGRQIQRPSSPPPEPPVAASATALVTTGQGKPSREPADLSPPTTADVYTSNVANSLAAALKEFKADKVQAREKWLGPASSQLITQPLKMHRTEQ
ncbi:Uncharacterised protein [Yersinia aldovae]|uniref:hypothetical protein n=1 Tax=Yersinia aldovae TaxID=29483 RepID=UPI0005E49142|nr:hypothetical protein [Yersinia aldovae]CNH51282.1 Uncharacterised protein [Yersinia aldovae]